MSSPMRTEDIEAGQARALVILKMLVEDGPAGPPLSPAASVAACAYAMAAIANLAECGSGPPRALFEAFYESIGKRMNELPSGKKL